MGSLRVEVAVYRVHPCACACTRHERGVALEAPRALFMRACVYIYIYRMYICIERE